MGGVLDGSGVNERYAVRFVMDCQQGVIVFGLVKDRVCGLCRAPGNFVEVVVFGKSEQRVEFGVVVMVDEFVGVSKEFEFLDGLLGLVLEKLGVSHADVGENADVRTDDVRKMLHLVRFGNAGLEDGEVVMLGDTPYGQGHADLGVVAVRALDDGEVIVEQYGEPFLDDGFAVGAGDADDGEVEMLAVVLGEGLQGGERVVHNQEVGAGVKIGASGVGHHEVAYAVLQELGDEPVSVVLGSLEGEEERLVGYAHLAAVVA